MKEFSDQNILLIGKGDLVKIAENCGFENFITINEYCAIYPDFVK